MRPICLTLSAFGPYAEKQTIDFRELKNRSFFLIHGPTGSGKTSILDGICFALYGNASGDTRTSKSLRSDYADINLSTIVEYEFSIGEHRYLIKRWPEQERPKKTGTGTTIQNAGAQLHYLDEDGNEEHIATGWSEVTRRIEELIGFKCDQFRQVVLLPQGEFRRLLTATSSERQEIMQTLFKTDIYRLIEEKLKAKAQEIKKSHEHLSHERSILLQEASTSSLNELEERMNTHKEQTKVLGEEVRAANALLEKAQKDLNDGQQIISLFKDHKEAQDTVTELQGKVPTVEQFQRDLEKALAASKLEDAENHLKQQEHDLEKLKQDEKNLTQALEQTTQKLTHAQEELKIQKAKEPERAQIATHILHLQQLFQGVQALVEAREEATKTQNTLEKILKEKDTLKEQMEKYQKYQEKSTPKLEALKEIQSEKGQRKLLLENFQQTLKKRESLDSISAQLKKIQSLTHAKKRSYDEVNHDLIGAKESLAKLQELWLQGQAGLMAASLTQDTPCPVCGSLHHPNPAQPSADTPSEKELKDLQERVQELEKKVQEAQKAWQTQATEQERLSSNHQYLLEELKDYGTMEFFALQELFKKAQDSYEESLRAERARNQLEEKLAELQTQLTKIQEKSEQLEQEWQNAHSTHNKALATLEERERQIPPELREPAALEKALYTAQIHQQKLKEELENAERTAQKAENDQVRIKSQLEQIRNNLESSQERFEEGKKSFELRIQKAGFTSLQEYAHSKWSPERIEKVQTRIKEFEFKLNSAQEHLRRAQERIKDLTPP
ncbi:MAG: SMC family ATPase, partial [Desulfitobacterium sp.]|nr:SMC family ATPase [Desulfitobacterium sp.]